MPPVSVTRLVPSGSTTMPKRRTSGGKAAAARRMSVNCTRLPPTKNARLVSGASVLA